MNYIAFAALTLSLFMLWFNVSFGPDNDQQRNRNIFYWGILAIINTISISL